MSKQISVLNVAPVHPGRGEPSRIELRIILEYLKGTPVATTTLSTEKALHLAEQLIQAVRVTS